MLKLILTAFFALATGLVAGHWFTPSPSTPITSSSSNLLLGDFAPDFSAASTEGQIQFHQWMGDESWTVLFSHPKAFTPVCTTELGVLALFKDEFAEKNTKIIALSVDTVENQKQWVKDINSTQHTPISFPIISDHDKRISELYGMIHPNSSDEFTVRSVFIFDPTKRLRLKMTYPASTGRNFGEILRVLESLQLADKNLIATPADWQPGDEVVISAELTDAQALTRFPLGFRKVLSYLRLTQLEETQKSSN